MLNIIRNGHRDLVRIKLVKVSHEGDDFFMRLATNLTMFIHHDGNHICIGEVDFMIPHENKIWILNDDKSISPRTDPTKIIGVKMDDPQQSLILMDADGEGFSNRLLFKMLERIPDYVDFRREFEFGNNKVILEQLRVRNNYEEQLKDVASKGGRLLRPSEIYRLLQKVNAPLCPNKEMWVVSAFEKWIHIGSYCASLKYKIGVRINKKNENDYDIYRKMPHAEIGQIYIIENTQAKKAEDIDEFLEMFSDHFQTDVNTTY